MEHKIAEDDMKKIAHYIAQREYSSQGGVKSYLKEYNETLTKLEDYNSSIEK